MILSWTLEFIAYLRHIVRCDVTVLKMNVGFEIQFCSLEKKEKGKEHHHHIGMWMRTIHILSSHCGALTHVNR